MLASRRSGEVALSDAVAAPELAAQQPAGKEALVLEHSEKTFVAESERAKRLDEKAEKTIAAVSLVIGFHLVDINRLFLRGALALVLPTWIAVAGLGCLSTALLLAFLAMRVQNYAGCSEGMGLIEDLRENAIDADLAKLLIARMYLRARHQNWAVNNKKAGLLALSSWFLLVGFLLAVMSVAAFKLLK